MKNKKVVKNVASDRGVTMTSLIIYIIGMTIIVGIVATITTYLQNNVNEFGENSDNISQILNFNMYFLEDVKLLNNKVINVQKNNEQITFLNGNTYTFNENAIYYNNVKICEDIESVRFELDNQNNILQVLIKTKSKPPFEKTFQYVMN